MWLLCFASKGPFGQGGCLPSSSRVCLSVDIFPVAVAGGYQARTHVYYQTTTTSSLLLSRGNLAHTLSIVFIPNHNKPSGPLPLPPSLSDLVALGCLSPLRESGDMNQTGTVGNQRVIAGLSMDENSRIDENEQTMSRSVRPTQPSASALLVSVCICVPRATRSSTPTSFQTPYPPNRRVAGWHLGHLGSRGEGGGGFLVGSWRNPRKDYGSSDAGARPF